MMETRDRIKRDNNMIVQKNEFSGDGITKAKGLSKTQLPFVLIIVLVGAVFFALPGCTSWTHPGRAAGRSPLLTVSQDQKDYDREKPADPASGEASPVVKARAEEGRKNAMPATASVQAKKNGLPGKNIKKSSKIINPFLALTSQAKKKDKGRAPAETLPPAPAQDQIQTRVHVELAFDNADIFEVLDVTLFELFKVNYIIDPHIKAKVSFHFSGDYSETEFINLLNNVLQLDNLSILPGPGRIYKVVRKNAGGFFSTTHVTRGDGSAPAGDISRLIRLRYLDSVEASKNIRFFASKGASVVVDRVNNAVVVTDTRENIDKIVNLMALMDVPYFKDISWRIIPVHEVESKDIAADLIKILKSAGFYNRPGAFKGGYQIIPIKSVNAILVLTTWPSILELVDSWVMALDHGDNAGTGVFVYFVENGTAKELADILKQLYGGKKSSGQKTQIVKPTATPSKKGKGTEAFNVSGDLSGDVEIIPDETNNAIIFKASQRDYKIIKNVLNDLDVVPRQVLINVVVAEVTLTDKTEYGVQWLLSSRAGDYHLQGGVDSENSSRTIDQVMGAVDGLTYGLYNSADVLKSLVKALGSDTDLEVLSSPNIMAVDNKEAFIEVGNETPLKTGAVTDTNGVVTDTIQFKKTGIVLKVTPHINSSGLVKLELSQEVSQLGTYDTVLQNYPILNRKAETSLVVQNNQTILMGGLMRSNKNKSNAGVPFLKDIPLLGYLFKTESKEKSKTELIILLTPHVVDSRAEADQVTWEFANKIESVKELLSEKRVQ